jgi:hypothetical protein
MDNPLKWHLTTKQLAELFKHIGIVDDDDNVSRIVNFSRGIESYLACYKEFNREESCTLTQSPSFFQVS